MTQIIIILTDCMNPLGVENSIIPNSAMTAGGGQVYPTYQARLNHIEGWCATRNAQYTVTYLQVDIGYVALVTGVATQGDPNWEPNFWATLRLQFGYDGSNFANVEAEDSNAVRVSIKT